MILAITVTAYSMIKNRNSNSKNNIKGKVSLWLGIIYHRLLIYYIDQVSSDLTGRSAQNSGKLRSVHKRDVLIYCRILTQSRPAHCLIPDTMSSKYSSVSMGWQQLLIITSQWSYVYILSHFCFRCSSSTLLFTERCQQDEGLTLKAERKILTRRFYLRVFLIHSLE